MDTAERIANVISIMTRIENKLDQWAGTPEEVRQLRADMDALRAAETAKEQKQETWREAIKRGFTTFMSIAFPEKKKHDS